MEGKWRGKSVSQAPCGSNKNSGLLGNMQGRELQRIDWEGRGGTTTIAICPPSEGCKEPLVIFLS
jgi:hypothetical protein